jgi:hypothetical protein
MRERSSNPTRVLTVELMRFATGDVMGGCATPLRPCKLYPTAQAMGSEHI